MPRVAKPPRKINTAAARDKKSSPRTYREIALDAKKFGGPVFGRRTVNFTPQQKSALTRFEKKFKKVRKSQKFVELTPQQLRKIPKQVIRTKTGAFFPRPTDARGVPLRGKFSVRLDGAMVARGEKLTTYTIVLPRSLVRKIAASRGRKETTIYVKPWLLKNYRDVYNRMTAMNVDRLTLRAGFHSNLSVEFSSFAKLEEYIADAENIHKTEVLTLVIAIQRI